MNNNWKTDKEFADKYLPQITQILKDNAKYIVNIVVAPYEDDALRATDFIIKVESGDVAGRLRRWSRFTINKEWTVRSRRDSGAETELSKLKKGFARWYLYGWTQDNVIFSWMLIDLDVVRIKKILDMPWKEKDNYDGTHFIIVPSTYLKHHGCIISYYNMGLLSKTDEINNNIQSFLDRFNTKGSNSITSV